MYEYAARCTKVVDGDTVDLMVDVGFGIHTQQRVRLLGINCPEHGTIAGDDATAFTKQWIQDHGPQLTVRTVLDRREKYGRLLAVILVPGHILNQDLITAGLAVDYDGGKRTLPTQPGEPDGPEPVR